MQATSIRVLIAGGNFDDANAYASGLAARGYRADIILRGEQLFERIQTDHVSLVIADLNLPGLSGLVFCRELRARQLPTYTYVILLSEHQDKADLLLSLEAGADDFLTKPVNINELEARLVSAQRRLALQQTLFEQNQKLQSARQDIERDLTAVSRLQRSTLPNRQLKISGVNVDCLFVPSLYVSGDHVNVFPLANRQLAFYILDVSGHGIPAAVRSILLTRLLTPNLTDSIIFEPNSTPHQQRLRQPNDVVSILNQQFQQTEPDLAYFTLVYGLLDPATGHGVFCQAGHLGPLILKNNGCIEVLGVGGYPVGLFPSATFDNTRFNLSSGDRFFLYSDGITEAVGHGGEQFGLSRFIQQLSQTKDTDLSAQLNLIENEIRAWVASNSNRGEFEDDVSILAIELATPSLDAPASVDFQNTLLKISSQQGHAQGLLLSQQQTGQTLLNNPVRVLLVDDSVSHQRLLAALLERWGCVVVQAENAAQALNIIQTNPPDMLLTDWDMPGMNGSELCTEIRRLSLSQYIYIVMITGFASRNELLESLKLGADDFLTKPVNVAELKVRINTGQRILSLYQQLRSNHSRLTQFNDVLDKDLRAVASMQRALLPPSVYESNSLVAAWCFEPMRYASGEHFGLIQLSSDAVGFFTVHLPGAGIPAALAVMSLSRWLSESHAAGVLFRKPSVADRGRWTLHAPSSIFEAIHALIEGQAENLDALEMIYGVLHLPDGQGQLCCLGHAASIKITAQGELQPLLATRPVTWREANFALASLSFQLNGGDRLLLLSPTVKRGFDRFFATSEALVASADLPLQEQLKRCVYVLDQSLTSVKTIEHNQLDLCILGLQWGAYTEKTPQALNTLAMLHIEKLLYTHVLTADHATIGAAISGLQFIHTMNLSNLQHIGQAVGQFAERAGLNDVASYFLDLAVVEICTNIIHHGYPLKSPLPTEVSVIHYENAIALSILDRGKPIQAQQFILAKERLASNAQGTEEASIATAAENGLGLLLIQSAADLTHYEQTESYNRILLLKYFEH